MKTTVNASGTTTARPYTNPLTPGAHTGTIPSNEIKANLTGIQKPPTNFNSKVEVKTLKIPDFLQKK